MSSVDNRIVKMGFENEQFTRAANSTMETLRKLGDSLKLSEGARGLESISEKVKNVDMSSLVNSVDQVRSRFSAMEIVGVTALVNITNSALNAGKNLVKSLTLDPITDGLSEYETKMGAIQTILTNTASKGTTLDQINLALADLNEYSDKTIYNFAQMTDNIGKMTAAGLSLEDGVSVVKGMSNVAAGFGVDATRMAGATYQMSQALSAGVVRLQDWNSMQQAGMGGTPLQDEILKTAESMGVVVDRSIPFRETLEQNWLTADIFTATMARMAEDPALLAAATNVTTLTKLLGVMKESVGSGWAVSWEKIFGDKDQSTKLFTGIYNSFNKIAGGMAEYRNEALATWNATGGREAVLNGLHNILTAISRILVPIYNAFKKIIDPWNGERLVSISQAFEKLTSKLVISDKASSAIGKTFQGLFTIVKVLSWALKPIGTILSALLTIAGPFVNAFLRMTGALTGWVGEIDGVNEASKGLDTMLSYITKGAEKLASYLNTVFNDAGKWMNVGMGYAKEYIGEFVTVLGDVIEVGKDKIVLISQFVTQFIEVYKPMEKAEVFVKDVFKGIQNGIQGFLDFTKSAMATIRGFFDNIVQRVKDSNIQGIDFVNAGLFATLLIVARKLIPFLKNLFSGVNDFKDSAIGVLDALQGTLESYQKSIKADIIKKIAIAIGILAASIWVLSKVDPDRLLPTMEAMGVLVAGLLGALFLFNKIDPAELSKSTASVIALIGISIALNRLASAMVKLSSLTWEQILKSIVGLSAACLAVFALTKTLNKSNLSPSQGSALMLMATSLYILAGALAIIGNLDSSTIFRSLTTIGIVLTGLSLFLNSTGGITNSVKIAVSLIPLTMSLLMLAGVLAIFGNMSVDTLQQGFIVLGTTLTMLSAFTNSMRGITTNMASVGAGLLLLSGALLILTSVIGIMGNMEISTLVVGISAMGATLMILAMALRLMPRNVPVMASSILMLSGAMLILSFAMKSFGEMTWESIAKGLTMMVGTLVAFGIAAALLVPVIPFMFAMAAGLAVLGIACGVIGGSLMLLSVGITMLSGSIVAGGLALTTALMSLCAVIPIFAAAVALGLVSFVTILGYNAKAIGRALDDLIRELLVAIINNIPLFVDGLELFFAELITALDNLTNQLVDAIVNLIMKLVDVLAEKLPIIVDKLITFIDDLVNDLLDALNEGTPKISKKIVDWLVTIIDEFGDGVVRVTEAIWDFVIKILNAFADSIDDNMPEVRKAVKRIAVAIGDELKECADGMLDIGGDIMEGLKNGIIGGIEKIKEAARNAASSALKAAKDFLGVGSESKEYDAVGESYNEGIARGITRHSGLVANATKGVSSEAVDNLKGALSNIDFNNTKVNGPVIKPVLDLSEVTNGVNGMNSLFGTRRLAVGLDAISNVRVPRIQNDNVNVVSAIKDLKKSINNISGGNSYSVNGLTYNEGSNVSDAIETLVRAVRIERRS